MRSRFHPNWLVFIPLAACFLPFARTTCFAAPHLCDGDTYEEVILKVVDLLQDAKYEESFQMAQSAITLASDRYEAYFHCGLARYKQDNLAAAERFMRSALERAPMAKRDLIQNALVAIKDKREFFTLLENGQSLAINKDYGMAASEFEKAWRLFPSQEAVGWRAAQMWKLAGKYPKSADVLNNILAQTNDSYTSQKCRQMLQELSSKLDTQYLDQAKSGFDKLGAGIPSTDDAEMRRRLYDEQQRRGDKKIDPRCIVRIQRKAAENDADYDARVRDATYRAQKSGCKSVSMQPE